MTIDHVIKDLCNQFEIERLYIFTSMDDDEKVMYYRLLKSLHDLSDHAVFRYEWIDSFLGIVIELKHGHLDSINGNIIFNDEQLSGIFSVEQCKQNKFTMTIQKSWYPNRNFSFKFHELKG